MNLFSTEYFEPSFDNEIKSTINFLQPEICKFVLVKAAAFIDYENFDKFEKYLYSFFDVKELETIAGFFYVWIKENRPDELAEIEKVYQSEDVYNVLVELKKKLIDDEDLKKLFAQVISEFKIEFSLEDFLMKNKIISRFGEVFNLSILELQYIFLLCFDYKKDFLFSNHNIGDLVGIIMMITGCSSDDASDLIQYKQNDFVNLKILDEPFKISSFINWIFITCGSIVAYEIYNKDYYKDSYTFESIYEENKKQSDFIDEIFSRLNPDEGFFTCIYGNDESREINFVSELCSRKGKKVYILDETEKNSKHLAQRLLLLSSVIREDGVILVPESCVNNLYFGSSFDLDITDDSDRNSLNLVLKLMQRIECPVFLFADPFKPDDFKSETDENTFSFIEEPKENELEVFAKDCLLLWEFKNGKAEDYEKNFCEFMRKNFVDKSLYEMAAPKCRELRISPLQWIRINGLLKIFGQMLDLSFEIIETALNSYATTSKYSTELRANKFYNLNALRTSVDAKDLVNMIMNANKIHKSEWTLESGLRILLYGISGAGKTAFVEYIAKELQMNLVSVRTSDIMRSKAGATEHNIRTIFMHAKNSNSILLIDEADSLLRDRGSLELNWEVSEVNEFIQQIERFPGILFCSTNLPEYLDRATNRRFHIQVEFKELDREGIKILFETYFKSISFDQNHVEKVFASGKVCPGDFGAVLGHLRFVDEEKINADFICDELIKTVKAKNKDGKELIGFGEI